VRTVSAVPVRPAAAEADRETFAPGRSALAAAILLLLSATTVILATIDSRSGRDYQVHTLLLGSDIALLVLVIVASGGLTAAFRGWRSHACALAGLAVGVAMVPALLVNPSDRGVAALLRWAGAVVLALTLGAVRGDGRRLVVGALAVVTTAHVAVALAERAGGGPVGLASIGEPSAYEIGGRYASTGLTVHPYVLAAWCAVVGTALLALVWRERAGRAATIGGVVAFAGIGLTMSRAGGVAAVLALGALAVTAVRRSSRTWRITVAAAGVALSLGLVLNWSGWASRAGQATTSVDAVSSGRGALLRQASGLFEDSPITGVGPGRYVLALVERPDLVALSPQSARPVHLTPFLLVVEGGILVVPALVLLGVAVAWACRRGGIAAVAVTLAMMPFLALDHLPWSYPQGIVLSGVWLGVLDLLARRANAADAADTAGAAEELQQAP
jgi:hypothetical protein